MTNEEAISYLEGQRACICSEDCQNNYDYTYCEQGFLCNDVEAINMAIEALKEQPEHSQNTSSKQPDLETLGVKTGETCEDVISRRDAIDVILSDKIDDASLEIMTALGEGRLALTLNDACDRHIRDIEKLPSVQPERKKGEWIRITQGEIPEKYICPFCHRTVESYGVEELLSICYPYCHCGADLRGD